MTVGAHSPNAGPNMTLGTVIKQSLLVSFVFTIGIWIVCFLGWLILSTSTTGSEFKENFDDLTGLLISMNLVLIGVFLGFNIFLQYQKMNVATPLEYASYNWTFFVGLVLTAFVFSVFLKTNLIVIGSGEVTGDDGFLLNNFDKNRITALVVGIVTGATSNSIVKRIVETIQQLVERKNPT